MSDVGGRLFFMSENHTLRAVGLFAGIGGVEKGFSDSGISAELLCEWWEPALRVLGTHWPDADLRSDVRELKSLPRTDVLSAGFPCTDLSQAGRMAGISGEASGLVGEVFRLLKTASPTWLVLENVRNMLVLDGGRAMHYLVSELETRGYRWAYRLIDSRSSGVAQRRQRVLLVASRTEDPSTVLFSDDAGDPGDKHLASDAFGFYWTEGFTGLGWAQDALPTLKGGSTIGIPSPPAFWHSAGPLGRKLLTPRIEDAEALQGFPRRWTESATELKKANGPRWKLVGNAVTVGVSKWLGSRLIEPGDGKVGERYLLEPGSKWPTAACGQSGEAWRVDVSMWPIRRSYRHLTSTINVGKAKPLSARATVGFLSRMNRSSLRFEENFRVDVARHAEFMQEQ